MQQVPCVPSWILLTFLVKKCIQVIAYLEENRKHGLDLPAAELWSDPPTHGTPFVASCGDQVHAHWLQLTIGVVATVQETIRVLDAHCPEELDIVDEESGSNAKEESRHWSFGLGEVVDLLVKSANTFVLEQEKVLPVKGVMGDVTGLEGVKAGLYEDSNYGQ